MVPVREAEEIILRHRRDYGVETLPFDQCLGRVLAEDIRADRDMPPYDRVTMDGIAIRYESFLNGIRSYRILSIQAAGDTPADIHAGDECVEIMTGAALSPTTDTVIPYEEIEIQDGRALVTSDQVQPRQNIHLQGRDKKKDDLLVAPGAFITPAVITAAASVGKTLLQVKKIPRVIIISTGDELKRVDETPTRFQIRRSNNYALHAVLQPYGVDAAMLHLPDEPGIMHEKLKQCLADYDVLLLSGGVSMGKFDHVPTVLEQLGVQKLFHKVRQRPGKPFWFGQRTDGPVVFAFPGNPVSSFMCMHRYFLPWLGACWQVTTRQAYAILSEDISFKPALQYFLQVKLENEQGQLFAKPVEGNGSGDFANLLSTDAFLELPMERDHFQRGEVFPLWAFRRMT